VRVFVWTESFDAIVALFMTTTVIETVPCALRPVESLIVYRNESGPT
jgi:hypothetical protein